MQTHGTHAHPFCLHACRCVQARVDLKAPGWVLLVEVLPVMGASFAALSALPAAMCTIKPKLQMRPVGRGK
jgi:hypothetical protein